MEEASVVRFLSAACVVTHPPALRSWSASVGIWKPPKLSCALDFQIYSPLRQFLCDAPSSVFSAIRDGGRCFERWLEHH